jgi:hypothetical protein
MNKIMEFIFDLIVVMVILFLSVFLYFGLRTETVILSMDKESTNEFLENIKKNAYFTQEDYERYLERLSLTDNLYDVQFEHNYTVFEPEYRMRTLEEILEAQRAAYAGKNIYHYREVETYAPQVTDPIDNSGLTMNTETNAGILAAAVSTGADPNHVHTDDCYDGHVHKGSPGPFEIPHAHDNTCGRYTCTIGFKNHCYSCGRDYFGWYSWYDPKGNGIGHDATLGKYCSYCGSSYTSQGEEIHDYAYTCGYNIDENGDGLYDEVPRGVIKYHKSTAPLYTESNITYTSGCYAYNDAWTWQDEENKSARDSTLYTTRTFLVAKDRGFLSYANIPNTFGFYLESPGIATMASIVYEAEYIPGTGLLFYFKCYSKYNYANNSAVNPGFPSPITEAQLVQMFSSKSNLVSTFNRIVRGGGTINADYNELYIGYSGNIDIIKYPCVNQWYTTCGLDGDGKLACSGIVTSITPTHPSQAVFIGEELITTARATYADGSTGVILCSTTFKTDAIVKNADVTISYTNIKGTVLTAHMTVTVVPRTRTCAHGHTYNLKPDGTDPGCPFCQAYVESIRVQSPNTAAMTITIGTTLQDNGLILLVKYLDGRTETISSGYVDNLDNGYVGTKLVTIGYKGATTSIMVTTVCKKMTCDICGYVYDLNPDGSNPGCPMCISKTPVFTGNVLTYDNIDYTDAILEDLYEDGIYFCGLGDTFEVEVKNRKSTPARNILRKVFISLPEQWLHIKQSVSIKER